MAERAYSVGGSALADAVGFINKQLELQGA